MTSLDRTESTRKVRLCSVRLPSLESRHQLEVQQVEPEEAHVRRTNT